MTYQLTSTDSEVCFQRSSQQSVVVCAGLLSACLDMFG